MPNADCPHVTRKLWWMTSYYLMQIVLKHSSAQKVFHLSMRAKYDEQKNMQKPPRLYYVLAHTRFLSNFTVELKI